jgi:hypothetical protein
LVRGFKAVDGSCGRVENVVAMFRVDVWFVDELALLELGMSEDGVVGTGTLRCSVSGMQVGCRWEAVVLACLGREVAVDRSDRLLLASTIVKRWRR